MNAKDIEALRAFYIGSRQQLYTYAVSITQNRAAAEDAIQGVFEKLLRSRTLPLDLRPYIFRAVRNSALDGWRRAKVRGDSMFETEGAAGIAELARPGEPRPEDLEPLLRQLADDERETIVLKIYSGLTFQEIADLRRTPMPTVASWYRRGLERLRIMVTPER